MTKQKIPAQLASARLEQDYKECTLYGIPADQLTKKALIGYIVKMEERHDSERRHHAESTQEWLALFTS